MSWLDTSIVDELRALAGPEAVRETIALFMSGGERSLAALREAQRQGDLEALARAAHTLRGRCAIIGARRMAELSAQLEDLARCGPRDGIAELLDKLEGEYANTRSALEAEERRPRSADEQRSR